MRRSAVAIIFLFSLLFSSVGHTQTSSSVWFTLNAPEGSVITASGPITLRYGQLVSTCAVTLTYGPCNGVPVGTPTPETWISPQTFSPSGSSSISFIVSNDTFGIDPLPGVYKTVQIQEQATAQTITINGQSVTVPGLASSVVWFTLNAPEGSVITASEPIMLRYGQLVSTCAVTLTYSPCNGVPVGTPTPETWISPQTFSPSGSSTISFIVSNDTFGIDPLPGVYKTVQIQEQATALTIIINGQSVTVPGLSDSSSCQLVANPSSINFQNTTLGYTLSFPASLTSNCSTAIAVSAVQVSGPYSVSGIKTPFSIYPNQTQNYTVVFAPTAAGSANGSINFLSNANSNVSVTLNGSGVTGSLATLTRSSTSLSFGNVGVNSAQSQTVTITNAGSTSITVSSVGVTGTGFLLGSLTTPFTLRAGLSQQITVTFSPAATGSNLGALTITSNAPNSPLSVSLVGTGVAAVNHTIALSWTGSVSQVAGYNVYRSTVSGGPYSAVNSSLVTTTSYQDQTVVSGTSYCYTVTAVGTNGIESGYSNEADVAVPNP
jgi:hypothetical protein